MKKLRILSLILLVPMLIATKSLAQKIEPIPVKKFYKDRVTRNLQFLCKGQECLDNVVVNDRGLYIYSTTSRVNKPEFILYWRELPYFNKILAERSHEDIIETLVRKGSHYFHGINDTHVNPARYPVSSFKDLKIALDPGHMASNFQEAILEKRYVKVEGEHYGQKKDISFFEANLAYATSLLLQEMLENEGAQVMLTHEYGKSSMGMNFETWKKGNIKKDIVNGYKNDWFSREQLEYLSSTDPSDFILFHEVFRNMDFVKRAEIINEFEPNLTLVIHYNASEDNQRYDDKFLKPVEENYSMVFVPGGFLGIEVDGSEQRDQRFELLRLLVSYDLEESDVFASNIIKALNDQLKVDALPEDNIFDFSTKYSNKSDLSEGVYHRNLYLTRVVKGPIAYSEALYQDNEKEVPLLGKKDLTVGGIKTSSRAKDVAKVYFSAIKEWLDYNKEIAKKLDALYESDYGDEDEYEADLKTSKGADN